MARHALHVGTDRPVFLTDGQRDLVIAALQKGDKTIVFNIANDGTGLLQEITLPLASVRIGIGTGQQPTADVFRWYVGEERIFEFTDGRLFIGTLRSHNGFWGAQWGDRVYYLPINEIANFKHNVGNNQLDGDAINSGHRAKALLPLSSPQTEQIVDAAIKARGHLVMLPDIRDDITAVEVALGLAARCGPDLTFIDTSIYVNLPFDTDKRPAELAIKRPAPVVVSRNFHDAQMAIEHEGAQRAFQLGIPEQKDLSKLDLVIMLQAAQRLLGKTPVSMVTGVGAAANRLYWQKRSSSMLHG